MREEGTAIFRETQRFTQPWIVALVSLLALGSWVMPVIYFASGRRGGADALEDALTLFTWALVGLGVPGLFLTMELVVEVRPDGLQVRFAPFHRRFRSFRWEEIEEFAGDPPGAPTTCAATGGCNWC